MDRLGEAFGITFHADLASARPVEGDNRPARVALNGQQMGMGRDHAFDQFRDALARGRPSPAPLRLCCTPQPGRRLAGALDHVWGGPLGDHR